MRIVPVKLGDRSYDVVVGSGAVEHLSELLPNSARRVGVITQPGIPKVDVSNVEIHELVVEDGEEAKTLATVERLCRDLARIGFTRGDAIVGVGGGVVTDLAGFVASVYHRGIAVVHVATTLLAQVDAAIGGKTGVNLPEGKNLVGAFWQPSGVVCDLDHLESLPERERRSGMGEMAKYHFLGGSGLRGKSLEEQVAMCVEIKADVVAEDEREGARRAILNYGHTLGHALEIAGSFDLRHGEAVSIGLVFAARLARRLGRIDDARVEEHVALLSEYDLPAQLPPRVDVDAILHLMARDKKAIQGLTFVLDGPRGVEPLRVAADDVRDELLAMAAER
ncbi:MAG TPA: 3-dehydroquinate synthase [Acidimicrobiales bacterium]|nr:3-dehydroquinate synthase [Acidimicrobiales bacterium]